MENLKRTHIQIAIWRNSPSVDPPTLNPLDYGWVKDPSSTCFIPTTVTDRVKLISDNLLKIIQYGCSSEDPCKPRDEPALNQDWHSRSSLNAKVASQVVTNLWTLKTVAGEKNIDGEEKNGLSKIQTLHFLLLLSLLLI